MNRSQAGSWQGRCAGAGLCSYEGAGWGPTMWQKAVHREPSDVFKLAATEVIKHTDKDHEHKATTTASNNARRHDIV